MKFMNQELKYGATTDRRPPADKEEVKLALHCGETSFWKLVKAGEFPNAFRIGNRWRVPWGDLEAYMERHRFGNDGTAA
jgi:predicted DNA-binding transcriptional regulator AlpA